MRPELALALLGAACSQIFGIEDAHYDSSLEGGTAGTSTPGQGGSDGGTSAQTGGSSTAGTGDGSMSGQGGSTSKGGSSGSATGGSGGTGNAGTATDGGAGAGGDDGEPPLGLCERYCEGVMSNCRGRYEQYRNFEQCMGICERLPEGSPGDENLNTVECRLRQVEFAEAEPFVYCKSSGPVGAGKCGSNCESYCSLIMATCTAETTAGVHGLAYFESEQSCLAACSAITPGENAPTEYTTSASVERVCFVGNHVYCRTYHVGSAIAEAAPDEHCPHAMGADPCVDP